MAVGVERVVAERERVLDETGAVGTEGVAIGVLAG